MNFQVFNDIKVYLQNNHKFKKKIKNGSFLAIRRKMANFANIKRNNNAFKQKRKTHFKTISHEK